MMHGSVAAFSVSIIVSMATRVNLVESTVNEIRVQTMFRVYTMQRATEESSEMGKTIIT